jgi:hypothetical protein
MMAAPQVNETELALAEAYDAEGAVLADVDAQAVELASSFPTAAKEARSSRMRFQLKPLVKDASTQLNVAGAGIEVQIGNVIEPSHCHEPKHVMAPAQGAFHPSTPTLVLREGEGEDKALKWRRSQAQDSRHS